MLEIYLKKIGIKTKMNVDEVREGGDITASDMVSPPEMPSEIEKFFEQSTIFLTGTTGFLGKLLLEKLLRGCPKIRKIYVLVRSKKDVDRNQRFLELFDGPVFENLKRSHPDYIQKVSMFSGDSLLPDLGLNEEDKQILLTEVSVIFNFAATVRFDQKLKAATYINVRSTRDLLKMAHQMKQLKAFVHCSTAYSYCPHEEIDEVFYKPPITGEKLLQLVELVDNDTLVAMTDLIIGKWPNTYVFTKAVAEEIIESSKLWLPVAIIRPSMVNATVREPIAGWSSIFSLTALTLAASLGVLRTMHADDEKLVDLVPADFVINCAIAAARNVAKDKIFTENMEQFSTQDNTHIYNYVSYTQNPIYWKEYIALTYAASNEIASENIIWHYGFKMHKNKYVHKICDFLFQKIPAYLVDAVLYCIGKKPMAIAMYQKFTTFAKLASHFTLREWRFKNDNTRNLWKSLNVTDKMKFDFDMGSVKWETMTSIQSKGLRVYLINEPFDSKIEWRKHRFMKRMKYLHYFTVTVLLALLLSAVFCFYEIFS